MFLQEVDGRREDIPPPVLPQEPHERVHGHDPREMYQLHPTPEVRNSKPETRYPKSETRKIETPNLKFIPQTLNSQPQTLSLELETLNPEP